MSSKPILFSGPMVRAILEGRKTMTRRIVQPQPKADIVDRHLYVDLVSPKQPGDILWVRETWCRGSVGFRENEYGDAEAYVSQRVGENDFLLKEAMTHDGIGIEGVAWKPSIFMPKEAARIFLRVTAVRVERLQEINAHQAILEGVDTGDVLENTPESGDFAGYAVGRFRDLWDSINAKRAGGAYAWDKNPWVWVISFERVDKPAGWPDRPSKEARNEAL